jgi:hypothetical protein
LPTEGSMPALASRAPYLIEMYWAPRSEFDAMLPIWGGDRIRRRPGDFADLCLQVETQANAEGVERFFQIDAHAAPRRGTARARGG